VIEVLLARFLPDVPDDRPQGPAIKQIATFACGNVRQALFDAKAAMLMVQCPVPTLTLPV
jgi:hypothetical protein